MSEEALKQLSPEDQAVLDRLRKIAQEIGLNPEDVNDCLDLQKAGEINCPVCGQENIGGRNNASYSTHFIDVHPELIFGQKS